MPDQYKNDIWDIKEWDIYKRATEKQKEIWHRNASSTKDKIDFTLCNNLHIREELKYVMYIIINNKEKISTFANNYNYFKTLCKFINNENKYNSLIDYGDSSYESYFAVKLKRKTSIKDSDYITKNMEKKECMKTNTAITFFYRCIEILKDYIDKDLPLMDRDVWKKEQILFINPSNKFRAVLDFTTIKQVSIKINVKNFCKYKLTTQQNGSVVKKLGYIKTFTNWLYSYNNNILHFCQLNREIIIIAI